VLASGFPLIKAIGMNPAVGLLLGLVHVAIGRGALIRSTIPNCRNRSSASRLGGVASPNHRTRARAARSRQVFTDKVGPLMPTWERSEAGFGREVLRGNGPRRGARRACPAAARCWPPSRRYTVEKKLGGKNANPPFARANIRGVAAPEFGQQRRRADVVHPDADARHPAPTR